MYRVLPKGSNNDCDAYVTGTLAEVKQWLTEHGPSGQQAKSKGLETVKECVFAVMAEAKAAAGAVCSARTLYYQVRPRIQKYTDATLAFNYFSQYLTPDYERTVAPLPGLYYEARGELHHPHDGQVIRLGTREVEAYVPPNWQFDKVLYVEKTGLEEQLEPYQLGQRFDMAVIFGQGYAVKACRELLAQFSVRDVTIFVLHDADVDGYQIAKTLAEATRRMPDHHIDVIDLGLTVPQAINAGLETEEFPRRKALPADLELDDDALEWFSGELVKGGHYRCTRCELNAFSADELAEFIEAGLRAHGAATKLMPPANVLEDYADMACDSTLAELVEERLHELIDIDAIAQQVREENPDLAAVKNAAVRKRFKADPTESWRFAAHRLIDANVDDADLADRIDEILAQQLGEAQ